MSRFHRSKRCLTRLVGVHPDLVDVVELASRRTTQDFMVVEGIRTLAKQREYVAKGASRTLSSYHLLQASGFGHAVDLAPLESKTIPWNDWSKFKALADVMKACPPTTPPADDSFGATTALWCSWRATTRSVGRLRWDDEALA